MCIYIVNETNYVLTNQNIYLYMHVRGAMREMVTGGDDKGPPIPVGRECSSYCFCWTNE